MSTAVDIAVAVCGSVCPCESVCLCVCVGGEVREKGIEADAGLTTVLLLLQPKWQALACVPIPILCSSLTVLESF